MRRVVVSAVLLCGLMIAAAQSVSLDSCRAMALRSNKQMLIEAEKINQAGYQRREAWAAYFPAIDFIGGYVYNQKDISILKSIQKM